MHHIDRARVRVLQKHERLCGHENACAHVGVCLWHTCVISAVNALGGKDFACFP